MHSWDKIKICFIAPKAYPLFNPDAKNVKDPFGGAEVDLYLLALELAKDKNFEVSFITADYGQKQVETIQNVKVIKSLDFDENPVKGVIRIWQAMKRANADIYVLKTASPGVPLVAFFCWLHHRAFVYRTAHERECNGTYIKEHTVLGPAFKLSLRTAKLVFTQNATDKEDLKRTTGVSSIFIRNAHYISDLSKKNRDIILWVGRSTPVKRPELFIDLAEQINNEKFVMVCPRALGDEKYERLTSRAGTVGNLEFVEQLPFHRINEFFQRAKIFVCTSTAEGFPNTYIQACANTVPILSLNVNPDGFLDEYNCGICCNNDTELLCNSLKFLLEQERYLQLGRNARKYAEEHHDITKIVERYKKTFMKLAQNLTCD